ERRGGRVRDDERRRRLRRHRPHAPDVQAQARRGQGRGRSRTRRTRRTEGLTMSPEALATLESVVRLVWLAGAAAFVLGLMRMNSPATARNGNLLSAGGMALAIGGPAVLLPAGGEGASPRGSSPWRGPSSAVAP